MSASPSKHVYLKIDILLNTTKSLRFFCLFVLLHFKMIFKNPPVACVPLLTACVFGRSSPDMT